MFKKVIRITGSYQENLYTDAEGCGFWEPEMAQVTSITDHERALKSGGWVKRDLLEQVDTTGREVIIYRIAVPEPGTYSVDLRIDVTNHDIENMSVFTSRRNMLDNKVNIKAGKSYQRSFGVNVTPYIPALSSKPVEDLAIYVSFTGSGVSKEAFDGACISFEIIGSRKDLPVIWVGGDSTVTDQHAGFPYYPYGSCCGWAQTLSRFITGAAVCNLAHSGLTTNCFRDDDHYAIMLKRILPGDVVILQFGHNDQKAGSNFAAPDGLFRDNVRQFVSEVRALGGKPILLSPIVRGTFDDDGNLYEAQLDNGTRLSQYATAMRELSVELGTDFVDMNALTHDLLVELGKAESAKLFAASAGKSGDSTPPIPAGADAFARLFVKNVKDRGLEVAALFS